MLPTYHKVSLQTHGAMGAMDAGGCWWISVIHDTHEREHATTIITPCGGWLGEREGNTNYTKTLK
jgi:hypothetical protein